MTAYQITTTKSTYSLFTGNYYDNDLPKDTCVHISEQEVAFRLILIYLF